MSSVTTTATPFTPKRRRVGHGTSIPMFASSPGPRRTAAPPMVTTRRPYVTSTRPPQTQAPKRYTTIPVPTLPPPGGDIPPYMLHEMREAKIRYEEAQKIATIGLPPTLKKIPVPTKPKLAPVKKQEASHEDPFSKLMSPLKNMLIPKWFQDEAQRASPRQTQAPRQPQEPRKPQSQPKRPRPRKQQALPQLPPPVNFPSYEQARRRNNQPPQHQQPNFRRPPANSNRPKPAIKSNNAKVPVSGNYADFFQQQMNQRRPIQLTAKNKYQHPYQFQVSHTLLILYGNYIS